MKALVAAVVLMLPAFAYAHRPYDSRLSTHRAELQKIRTSSGGSAGVTQPSTWTPEKQSAGEQKASPASHGS